MNWVDYREKLGLGFSDAEKLIKLKTNLLTFIENSPRIGSYAQDALLKFCLDTGTPFPGNCTSSVARTFLVNTFKKNSTSIADLLSYYIAFMNIAPHDSDLREYLLNFIQNQLHSVNIGFELIDDNGYTLIFPNGAKELDVSLVTEPLEWLIDYPVTRKTFVNALEQYSDSKYTRDIADNFRKTLEQFLQEFFDNKKNLANNIAEVSKYMKEVEGIEELASVFKNLLNAYDSLNNKYVKHHDLINPIFLEFLLYQTGLFIRMLIVIRKSTK